MAWTAAHSTKVLFTNSVPLPVRNRSRTKACMTSARMRQRAGPRRDAQAAGVGGKRLRALDAGLDLARRARASGRRDSRGGGRNSSRSRSRGSRRTSARRTGHAAPRRFEDPGIERRQPAGAADAGKQRGGPRAVSPPPNSAAETRPDPRAPSSASGTRTPVPVEAAPQLLRLDGDAARHRSGRSAGAARPAG